MSDPDSPVLFECGRTRLARSALIAFANALQSEVANRRPFACLITTDSELRRLNREYLAHDYPTDVLSFPTGLRDGSLGDIAISVERARVQARDFGHTIDEELRILMLHGLLHLLGMDHETDAGRMVRAETKWRKHFDLPVGLIERVRV